MQKKTYYITTTLTACIMALMRNLFETIDDYFMYLQGKDILTGNIHRTTDFLSLHEGFAFLHQKWLMCIATYIAWTAGEEKGLYVAGFIISFILYMSVFMCMDKLNPKYRILNLITGAVAILPIAISREFRPQIISMTMLILMITALEQYTNGQNSNHKRLYIKLTIYSLITMWFHSTMWYLCLIYMLPYIAETLIPENKYIKTQKYDRKPIWISTACIILSSILQPNGIKQYPYMFGCINATNDKYKILVDELETISITDPKILISIIEISLIIYIIINTKKIIPRHILLISGSVLMAVLSRRMIYYQIILITPIIAEMMNTLPKENKVIQWTQNKTNRIFLQIMTITITVMIIAFCKVILISTPLKANQYTKAGYYTIDLIRENSKTENPKIFSSSIRINTYSLLYSMKPYIDGRIEIFDKNINKKEDIIQEIIDVATNIENEPENTPEIINSLQTKYDFDYYIIYKANDIVTKSLINTLKNNAYTNYEDELWTIFSTKDTQTFTKIPNTEYLRLYQNSQFH